MIGFGAVVTFIIIILLSVERFPVASWLWAVLFTLIVLTTLRELVRP